MRSSGPGSRQSGPGLWEEEQITEDAIQIENGVSQHIGNRKEGGQKSEDVMIPGEGISHFSIEKY